jgi:uncharacterized protein (TIGR03083 family)
MGEKSPKQMAREEREELAALLAELSPQQWEHQSLCDRWRVRDVVAHVISYDELSGLELVQRFAKGALLTNRVNAVGVAEYGGRTPEQLRQILASHLKPRGLTAGFGGMIGLVDGMIHQQDIRRPLGIPRAIPPDRMCAALDFARYAPTIRGAWRARRVRLIATDVDWAHGGGPEVRGPGEALLMVMAGRRGALEDLSGPGHAKLANNLGG